MIPVGSLIKFCWWSNYKAPSLSVNELGNATWHELSPGDKGVVVGYVNEETVIVLFSSVDSLLKIHRSMLCMV